MSAPLQLALDAYGARGVPGLEEVVDSNPPAASWLTALVEAATRPEAEVPATWLVRAYLERGVELDAATTAAWIRAGARLRANDARLHFCQSVARLEVASRSAAPLARTLRAASTSEHKFTRAWALDALHRLSLQHPRYGTDALAALERALADPAPSVRARARHVARERGMRPG